MRRKQDKQGLLEPPSPMKTSGPFDPSRWATPKEAALILRRLKRKDQSAPSEGAIRNMVYRGQLIAQKFFGRLLFDREYLNQLVAMAPQTKGAL